MDVAPWCYKLDGLDQMDIDKHFQLLGQTSGFERVQNMHFCSKFGDENLQNNFKISR